MHLDPRPRKLGAFYFCSFFVAKGLDTAKVACSNMITNQANQGNTMKISTKYSSKIITTDANGWYAELINLGNTITIQWGARKGIHSFPELDAAVITAMGPYFGNLRRGLLEDRIQECRSEDAAINHINAAWATLQVYLLAI